MIEYDYHAESMLALFEFSELDNPEEEELKTQVIRAYNRRLDLRIKRK